MPVIRFSGAQTLSIADNVALRPDSGPFHIFMVARNSSGFQSKMLQKGNVLSTAAGYTIILDTTATPSGAVSCYVRCGGAASSRGSQGFLNYPETFNLIEIVLDGSTITGFLNGTNTGWVSGGEGPTGNTYTAPISNTDPLVIGTIGSPGSVFDLAELLIVKGTLTADQIAQCQNYFMTEYAVGVPNAVNLGTPQVLATAGQQFFGCRIPALVACANGDVLAFYEGRSNGTDSGFIPIVMLRSTDGGRTFPNTTGQVVTSDGVNAYHNPTPILDATTGKLILLSSWNLGTTDQTTIISTGGIPNTSHAFQQISTDNGHTWSAPVDISAMAKPATSTWWVPGPGGQKQLTSGRLLIPCYNSQPTFATTVPERSNTMYSDDHGVTWTIGGSVSIDGPNEWRIWQRQSDGLIYGLLRDDNSNQFARSLTTSDQGVTLTPTATNGVVDLVAPPTNRGLTGDGTNLMICSHPYNINLSRNNLTINITTDFGATWPASTLVVPGTSAYSDLLPLGGGLYGMFYEIGGGNLNYVTFTVAYPAYSA